MDAIIDESAPVVETAPIVGPEAGVELSPMIESTPNTGATEL
jgi:hypothetical protein